MGTGVAVGGVVGAGVDVGGEVGKGSEVEVGGAVGIGVDVGGVVGTGVMAGGAVGAGVELGGGVGTGVLAVGLGDGFCVGLGTGVLFACAAQTDIKSRNEAVAKILLLEIDRLIVDIDLHSANFSPWPIVPAKLKRASAASEDCGQASAAQRTRSGPINSVGATGQSANFRAR